VTRLASRPSGDHGSKLGGDAEPSLGLCQQHHATVRSDPATVERRGDFLASDGWKRKRQERIVGHGGCGRPGCRRRVGFSNRILRNIKRLSYIRQFVPRAVVNKMG
jgi:hypothetical protein